MVSGVPCAQVRYLVHGPVHEKENGVVQDDPRDDFCQQIGKFRRVIGHSVGYKRCRGRNDQLPEKDTNPVGGSRVKERT